MHAYPLLTVCASLSLLSLALPAQADDESPGPGQVSIGSVSTSGNGCPTPGDVAISLSPDGQALTAIFDRYAVETHGQDGDTRARKACRVELSLNAPAGWTYSLFSLDLRGYASLEAGTTGIQTVRYKFSQGQVQDKELGRLVLQGPFQDDYTRALDIPVQTLNWRNCAANDRLQLDTAIAVQSTAGSSGTLSVDSLDGEMAHQYGILWKRCGAPNSPNAKFVAMCKATLSSQGQDFEFSGRGRGPDPKKARQKAKQHALQRCLKESDGRHRGNACNVVETSCKVAEINEQR